MDSKGKSEINIIFGKILRDYRIKNRFTQERMAEELGISVKYISRIENGNGGVKTETLIKYMNILGISPNVLYQKFINNEKVKNQIELSEMVNDLSDDKIDFLISLIDLLKNLK